ncbi:MAG: hypothetical protein ACRD1R_17000 [Acidobacteriota bacterium]
MEISAATIDRLWAAEKRKMRLKGRSGTKPGTLLKYQIPSKRFWEWREDRPGFVERRGSRITKKYDVPQTPYQRVWESPEVSSEKKGPVRQPYQDLNPAELARQINLLQNQLLFRATV